MYLRLRELRYAMSLYQTLISCFQAVQTREITILPDMLPWMVPPVSRSQNIHVTFYVVFGAEQYWVGYYRICIPSGYKVIVPGGQKENS